LTASAENTQVSVRKTYERVFPPGGIIFDEGDAGDVLFVIQAGQIELSRKGPDGWSSVARLGPGEFFGEMSVILGEGRTARAVATTESRLLELDTETLEGMCMERPEVAIRIISRLTTRLIRAERRLAALGIDDLLRPLVRSLVRRAVADSKRGVRIDVNLRTLASDSGLTMVEAHRALHQLLDQKTLRLVDDVLYAADIDCLSATIDVAA
jgi:CRP/FNR family cyclic AMP-dependent transcriptional regulator